MIPKFKIRSLSVSRKATYQFREIMTEDVLMEIAKKLTNQDIYEVEWLEKRNEGRYIFLETDEHVYFISISNYGLVTGRNSYMQNVATAYTDFLNFQTDKSKEFCYYSVYYEGNNKTNLLKFYYKLMKTFGCRFINEDYIMGGHIINTPYTTVKEIIRSRNALRVTNLSNQSSYITEEGDFYHFYGKTFGANSKETVLICYALSAIADKTIRLFQIADNDSVSLGKEDQKMIEMLGKIEIVGVGYDFDENSNELKEKDPNDIRDQVRFNFNLLSRLGEKQCIMCDCKIDSLIHAAHVWPIASIKGDTNLSLEEKREHAISEHNGVWLCQNHHKLFDMNFISINHNSSVINQNLSECNKNFLEYITTKLFIPENYITREFNNYLNRRHEYYNS